MTWTTLHHRVEDGILTVTLDRPDRLNAFTPTMAGELERTFTEVNEDDDVRAVVVTGAGTAFCAGMDLGSDGNVFGLDESLTPTLTDMSDLNSPDISRVRDTGGRVTLAIHACRKPVIAAINGPAVGIGATMTLAMDARLMSTTARFGLVFGRLGITPEAASTWFLPRLVGLPRALDLLYSAEILDAEAAEAAGLANAVHDPDHLAKEARALADRWTLGRSRVATALTRQMTVRNASLERPEDAHRVESLAMFYSSVGDGAEGVSAFREKRTPRFTRPASAMPPFYGEWIAAIENA
ncbi:enoyl-CoA hydratase [Streptomyces cinereoruber]|uniref:Enoyl-CoA hydratase n=1 Tax=Streptomyces cinereoruber TaxID=67260 RepID=A0AAV4KR72_9ACTN|nr:enoyl-CoA hydratase-related protein [Streptomyces cinereoruber]MBB4158128.1 enoyl-CoA hydratase/carnithine racemase [Streptomyces cinereoruber]MBY8819336.1 enoyl-CoA hydratase/isomerase family protein [Streptomyces cinereoruber]NIH61719.1 enoyl-CoA hydratase/carnithine racemase [Streptomyces cinereoruber]QEV35935.1 enoyl-CoA hydratase [Streptomyces cinereoruber]GGR49705.1 enoyl-CoA hydratase [Streptomyces cinereoruber]